HAGATTSTHLRRPRHPRGGHAPRQDLAANSGGRPHRIVTKTSAKPPILLDFPRKTAEVGLVYRAKQMCPSPAQHIRPNGPAEHSPGLRPQADALGEKTTHRRRPERPREIFSSVGPVQPRFSRPYRPQGE